jgi:hypothetical protein
MNFERHNIDPRRTLDIGRRSVKKERIQNLLYKESFGSHGMMWMGMGNIIDLIKETKDGEYIEIFYDDFLQYFAIPLRKGEKWRWEEIIPQFPTHELLMKIVASFSNID